MLKINKYKWFILPIPNLYEKVISLRKLIIKDTSSYELGTAGKPTGLGRTGPAHNGNLVSPVSRIPVFRPVFKSEVRPCLSRFPVIFWPPFLHSIEFHQPPLKLVWDQLQYSNVHQSSLQFNAQRQRTMAAASELARTAKPSTTLCLITLELADSTLLILEVTQFISHCPCLKIMSHFVFIVKLNRVWLILTDLYVLTMLSF